MRVQARIDDGHNIKTTHTLTKEKAYINKLELEKAHGTRVPSTKMDALALFFFFFFCDGDHRAYVDQERSNQADGYGRDGISTRTSDAELLPISDGRVLLMVRLPSVGAADGTLSKGMASRPRMALGSGSCDGSGGDGGGPTEDNRPDPAEGGGSAKSELRTDKADDEEEEAATAVAAAASAAAAAAAMDSTPRRMSSTTTALLV